MGASLPSACVSPTHPARTGALMALTAGACFATLAVFGRLADDHGLASGTLLQWRFGAAAVILAAWGHLTTAMPARTRLALLGSGLIYTVQTSLYFAGLARITAGTTALLLYLSPAFVIVYGLVIGRRPTLLHVIAVVTAVAGLAVVVGVPSGADASVTGLLAGLGAGATFGVYVLLGELVFDGVPPLVTAAHSMAGACVGFVLVDLVEHGGLDLPGGSSQWAVVAGVVVVPTLLAIPLLFGAVERIGAGLTALIATTEPVFTVLFGAWFLDEAPGVNQVVGGALILAAALLAQRSAGDAAVLRVAAEAGDPVS